MFTKTKDLPEGTRIWTVLASAGLLAFLLFVVAPAPSEDFIPVAVADKYEIKDAQVRALALEKQLKPYLDQLAALQIAVKTKVDAVREKYDAPEPAWEFDADLNLRRAAPKEAVTDADTSVSAPPAGN